MFKKGDYIVLVKMDVGWSGGYFINHVYKQAYDCLYLRTELDSIGSMTNGWDCYKFTNTDIDFEWRYATIDEIIAYENAGKPIDITTIKKEKRKGMRKIINEILEKTYDNEVLRKTTVPLLMSNPGTGKSSSVREFAKSRGVHMLKLTLSQRMPNEVSGMMYPNAKTAKLDVFDSYELYSLKDGDILFIDEVFNGTLKQTLDAFLNILEDRTLPSGKKLANILIIAASNPQGLINITPQIKERFIRYDLKFDEQEYMDYLKSKYGIPNSIAKHFCILINKEKFEHEKWNYFTPRSIEKALNQIGVNLPTPYDRDLLPFLSQEVECPSPIDLPSLNVKKGENIEFLKLFRLTIKEI